MKATRLILLTLTLVAGLGNAAAAPALRFEGGLHAELDGGARVIVHGRISSAAAAPSDPFDRATIVQGRPATAAGKPLPPPLTTGTAEHTESAGDSLASSFRSPPNESKPWCYWWWLNGAASKEGITRDFEEMRRQGISGALLFDAGEAGPEAPRGPPFMSAEWRGLYQHAVREADRCGLALGVNLCSGWNAGGPWVTHEHAAKKLVSAQTVVQGPGRLSVAVPKPPAVQEFYRDIAVLAAPIPDDAIAGGKLLASSQYQHYGPALAEDGDDESRWVSNGGKPGLGPTPEKPEFLQFDFDAPRMAAGVYLKPYSECGPQDVEVQCADDGQAFRPIKRLALKPREAVTIAFDEVRARQFRIVFRSAHSYRDGASWNVQVAEIALLAKDQLVGAKPLARSVWNRAGAVEVTRFLGQNGRLDWDVPAGRWQVLRIGSTLHANALKCVGGGPSGLEIDPMSAEAMDAHFAETGAKLIADAGPLAGRSLQYFHIDSWELGQPTWTPRMREEFQRRRGYDPLPWLPAVLGRTVDNAAETRRFLQDYRRTAADLVAAHYYGRLRELTVKGGLRGTHPESGGPFFTHWIDALQCEGINDVPMGEFWKRNREPDGPIGHHHNPSLKQAACAAHIYGKRDCQAEAFTSFGDDWMDDPWSMKDIGDAAFCEGLTRNVLCFWVHQPQLEAKPGFQWAHVGTHFDCHLTWWPMSRAWLTYLARCQHLLRQGGFVADFAYLQDEAIPGFIAPRPQQPPPRPAGFDYDVLNAEVLLTRASASNRRLALPGGMSYRYLVLPHEPDALLSPATLKRVNELAEAGVTVIGPKALGGSVARMRQGPLEAVTRADGLHPDIEFRNPSPGANFDWIHRRSGDTEIYFISNQAAQDATADVAFRVTGKQPELWDAVTGHIRDLRAWREDHHRTIVPLQCAPRQSWFVVFRKERTASRTPDTKNFPETKTALEIAGPWEVRFDPKWGGPERIRFEKLADWTTRPEDGIRHYSGIATYACTFQIAHFKSQLLLDLGTVKNVARVRLNGHDLGVVWTAPWQIEITGAVKPGANALEIDVANLWPNRLIGDATLPKEKRFTVTNVRTYDSMTSGTYGCATCEERKRTGKPAALLPSGLLGPVTIQSTVPAVPEKELPMPGEVFVVAGRTAFVIPGKGAAAAPAKPWVWYAPTLPGLPSQAEQWMFEKFRDAGIAVAGLDVGESYGSLAGCALYAALYDEMTGTRGYSPKPVLLGRSRGGLMALSWAAANPDKVAGFAGIYPVCNLASYPGVAQAAAAYAMQPDALQARLAEHNPVDRLAPLAKAGVPLFAIHGDRDQVVPLEANSALLKTRYAALGGSMQLMVPPGQGHNMWTGFFQCEELVNFVKQLAKP